MIIASSGELHMAATSSWPCRRSPEHDCPPSSPRRRSPERRLAGFSGGEDVQDSTEEYRKNIEEQYER